MPATRIAAGRELSGGGLLRPSGAVPQQRPHGSAANGAGRRLRRGRTCRTSRTSKAAGVAGTRTGPPHTPTGTARHAGVVAGTAEPGRGRSRPHDGRTGNLRSASCRRAVRTDPHSKPPVTDAHRGGDADDSRSPRDRFGRPTCRAGEAGSDGAPYRAMKPQASAVNRGMGPVGPRQPLPIGGGLGGCGRGPPAFGGCHPANTDAPAGRPDTTGLSGGDRAR